MMGKAVRLPPDKNHREPMAMPIHRLLQNHVFDPDTIAVIVTPLRMPCASYGSPIVPIRQQSWSPGRSSNLPKGESETLLACAIRS